MVLNDTFNNISVIQWRSVYGWRKPEYLEKIPYLPLVIDKLLSDNVVLSTHRLSGIRIHNANGDRLPIAYVGSCKSNYYAIKPLLTIKDELMR